MRSQEGDGDSGNGSTLVQSHEVGYYGCTADHNVDGLSATATGSANIRWYGGVIRNSSTVGVNLDTTASSGNFVFAGEVVLTANALDSTTASETPVNINGIKGTRSAAPTFPTSGTAWTSSFPTPVQVCRSGSALTAVTADGAGMPGWLVANGFATLRPDAQITIAYTGTPAWTLWSLL